MAIQRLKDISESLKAGNSPNPVSTRTFLSWFSAQRRGYWIVRDIRAQLKELEIKTVPDFESAYIDGLIGFVTVPKEVKKPSPKTKTATEPQTPAPESPEDTVDLVREDPTYRISKLLAANKEVVSITPDASREQIITLLLARGFAQIPVMTSDREVKGVVSWRSITTKTHFNANANTAKELMDSHHEIRADCSMFDAIPLIDEHNYVLIRGDDKRITGIVTSSDMNDQFQSLTEPFLLIGEIENLLRSFIDEKFSSDSLKACLKIEGETSHIKGASDLNFGDYVRLIENPDHWPKLGLRIDRAVFCKDMERTREIRNDVMHFDPDGVPSEDLEFLRRTAAFMKNIRLATYG